MSAPPSLGHGIRIGTGTAAGTVEEIKNPNSVMKGITENLPCGAFRPAGNGEWGIPPGRDFATEKA